MGWISLRTSASAKEFLHLEFTYDNEDRRSSVLDSVFGDDGVYYAAVELAWTGTDVRVVFSLVCLVENKGCPAFGYKPISEAMGPRSFGCPPASSISSRRPASPMPSPGARTADSAAQSAPRPSPTETRFITNGPANAPGRWHSWEYSVESNYLRLGVNIWARDVAVIRAAWRFLAAHVRRDPARRQNRKDFYRSMLERHRAHQYLAEEFRL